MTLVAVALVAAVLAAWRCGGTLAALARRPPKAARLVVLAALAQGLAALLGGRSYAVGLAVSAFFAAAFLVRNRRRAGLPLVALGFGLNALVVAVNGAMPVSRHAAERAGVVLSDDERHEPATSATRLAPLGDVLPVPLPPRREVTSPGDVLVAAGLALYVFHGMRTPRRARSTRQAPSVPAAPDRPGVRLRGLPPAARGAARGRGRAARRARTPRRRSGAPGP